MKYILLLALGLIVVYWVLKRYHRRVPRPGTPPATGSEDMVRCAHCGVHLPRSESLTTQGKFYCTPEHRRQDTNV